MLWFGVLSKELSCSHTIMTDRTQQTISVGSFGVRARPAI
jgi:hypothetical protein